MEKQGNGQDKSYLENPESLDLNPSVLTDRDGSATALMDKSGIHVFSNEAEAQIKQYIQLEQDKQLYLRKEVFRENVDQVDKELKLIEEQVFAMTAIPNNINVDKIPDFKEKGNIVWFIILSIFCIYISLSYGRFKKKEREKKIADLNNSYDE